ncbi:hypothetical protein G210_3112 [Candida maltosa Xu316]|uniref:DUF1746 domain-containing protein n=1 Tax=Candida maltosa (strain Xu316) TaxID=1245528 RepID=M3HH69_CANMX|nr:hypothetical protein G210_3112 [Candida maltosa Xu316]
MNRFTLPGSFHTDHLTPSRSRPVNATTTAEMEAQQKVQFEQNQLIHTKTRSQHDIISQLDILVYILVFYQFIKYCHLAFLTPLALHLLFQSLLNSKYITQHQQFPDLLLFLTDDNDDDEQQQSRRSQFYDQFVHKYCYLLYVKTIIVLLYHVLVICTWAMALVNSQQLDVLRNGNWWFVSFIGEEIPEISVSSPYWVKLYRLGLIQLLFTDLLILFVQLVLYQCIYKQSDAFHLDRRVNEKEVYIIRTSESNSSSVVVDDHSVQADDTGIFTVLKVRLYECFQSDAYVC